MCVCLFWYSLAYLKFLVLYIDWAFIVDKKYCNLLFNFINFHKKKQVVSLLNLTGVWFIHFQLQNQ